MKINRRLYFILSSIFFINIHSYSAGIDELLSKYEEESDLSKKTKIESLGHYIVISRRDIDIMQAYTLSDVLKSLKLHTYTPNRFGVYQLVSASSMVAVNTSYRLYIDDHEVSSIHTDNPFLMFDNYPLDGIDHIEIYYGSGAVRLGNEPSLIIIKLYTKEPSRENSATVRFSTSTRKDGTISFNDARVIKDNISYNFLANLSYYNFPPTHVYGESIDRDIKGGYIFFKFKYYDTDIDLSYINISRDAFAGLAVDFTPEISKTKSEDFYINITQKFLDDKSLKLNISIDTNYRTGEFSNSLTGGGVFATWIYPYPTNPSKIPFYYYERRRLTKYNLYLSKEFKTENNTTLIGASYKIKDNDIKNIYYKTPSGEFNLKEILPFNRVNLLTAFVENQYNLTDRNLIFTGIKLDHHSRNGGYRDITEYTARVGFTSFLSENLYIKGFLNRTYVPPSFYEVEMSLNGQDLKTEKISGASFEVEYKKENHKVNLFYGYAKAKDMIVFTPVAQNINKKLEAQFLSVDYEYKINFGNKISLNIHKTFNNSDEFSSQDGGSIKLFNSNDRFDLYNELIYRKGFKLYGKKIDDSFDYNLGLSYRLDRNLSLKFKGENLLNSSPKSVFVNSVGNIIVLPSFCRRFIFSIEKVF